MIMKLPTVRMFGIGLRTWYSNFTMIQRFDRFDRLREKERVLRGEGEKRKGEKEEAPSV